MTTLIDVDAQLVTHAGESAIRRTQEIPDAHIQRLREEREGARFAADFRKVASIPVALVEHWRREGFDVFTAPAREIVARLRREDLSAFIVSNA